MCSTRWRSACARRLGVTLLFTIVPVQVNPQETSLLVTEPYLNLPNVANTYDQMIFEEWEFASCHRCTREFSLLFALEGWLYKGLVLSLPFRI